ncbi:hypothetical protein TALK_10330 [Thalassospira alkalitolerans]|uniref:Uncharacterized protein n=1 Tax=Thalassospira alkalitolerans TaxID=1293890 RepID=A0A1Y2LD83_9PROT|nr:hypothetical protein TALK_10330 [Thalassospira alkalitolerans]
MLGNILNLVAGHVQKRARDSFRCLKRPVGIFNGRFQARYDLCLKGASYENGLLLMFKRAGLSKKPQMP